MATLVTKTLGTGKDYANLAALAAANVDLVALDQYWEVTCDDMVDRDGANFNGWNTSNTCYLHIKAKTLPTKPRFDAFGATGYRVFGINNGITVTDIATAGTEGLIIFEGVQVQVGLGAAAHAFYTAPGAVETQIQFHRCILQAMGAAGGSAIYQNGTKSVIKCYNTFCLSAADIAVQMIQASINHCDMYNCTVFGGTAGINCGGRANVLKNCYFSGTAGIQNAAAATITTCSTSDATGDPAGLDNHAKNLTNFRALGKGHEDCRPMPDNATLIAAGTAIAEGFTLDLIGQSWVVATPTVGCCEHIAADPYIIRRTYCNTAGSYTTYDYSTIDSICDLNLDLVTGTMVLIIEMYADAGDSTACTLDGWNTSSTYYLHFRPAKEANDVAEHSFHGEISPYNAVWQDYQPNLQVGALALTVGDIGATGFVHFEGLNIIGTDPTISIGANFSNAGAVLRFSRCSLGNWTNEKKLIVDNAASAGTVQLFNCILASDNTIIDPNGSVDYKVYHCTGLLTGNGGAGNIGFDGNDHAGTEFVNCVVLVNPAFAGASAYANLTDVTFTKCAASDATGSEAGLDSIAISTDNFNSVSGSWGRDYDLGIPTASSVLYKAGADLSGYAAPYNISIDYAGCARTTPPSIGAADFFDMPNRITLASFNQGGVGHTFNATHDLIATCIEKAGSKYYVGCGYAVAAKTPSVYETTAFVDFDEVFTVADANNYIAGLATDNVYLYVLYKSTALVQKMLIADGTWSAAAAANLGGAAGSPATPVELVHFDSHLFAAVAANATATIYECNDADEGAVWTASLLDTSTNDCRRMSVCNNKLVAVLETGDIYVRAVGGSWARTQRIPWFWQTDGNSISLQKIGTDLYLTVMDKGCSENIASMWKMNWTSLQFELMAFPTWNNFATTLWGTTSSPRARYFLDVSGAYYKQFTVSKDECNHRQWVRRNTDTPAANEPYTSSYNTYLMGQDKNVYRFGNKTFICGGGGSAPSGAGLFETNEYTDSSGNTILMYGGVA